MNIEDFRSSQVVNWFCEFLGYEVEVTVELEEGEELSDYGSVIEMIDSWDSSFFLKLESMLFSYYKNTLIMRDGKEPAINSQSEIWNLVRIGDLVLHTHDSQQFILASGGCDWEEEHGLEIDISCQNQIVYVGPFISNGFYEDPSKPSTYNFIEGNA